MTESPEARGGAPIESSIPVGAVPLESILCTEELDRRPSRPPSHEEENRALVKLASALADSPSTILQALAETILDITQCDSAGVSLLTSDGQTPDACGDRFYWPAIAGIWNPHVGGGTPRNFGPCGDVLDQNRTLLFKHFERRYPYLLPVVPAAEECLLVPFYVAAKAVGTIWSIMHSDRRKFDAEDDRVMGSLGTFASSAYQVLTSIDELRFQIGEREKVEAALQELADGLEMQVRVRTQELVASRARVVTSSDAARQRLARDLHDGAQQLFVSSVINLQRAQQEWSSSPQQARRLLDEGLCDAQNGISQLREIAAGIHPAILTQRGLAAALDALAARVAVLVELDVMAGRLPEPVESGIYFFCSEALTNIGKHAHAKSAWVRVALQGDRCTVEVRDDGLGGAEPGPPSSGLTGLRDRIGALGGGVDISSPAGAGTVLRAWIPLSSEPARPARESRA